MCTALRGLREPRGDRGGAIARCFRWEGGRGAGGGGGDGCFGLRFEMSIGRVGERPAGPRAAVEVEVVTCKASSLERLYFPSKLLT